jgi:chromosome segregation ATPase
VQLRRRDVLEQPQAGGLGCPLLEESRVCNTGPCSSLLASASAEELAKHAPSSAEVESSPEVMAARNKLTVAEADEAQAAQVLSAAESAASESIQDSQVAAEEAHRAGLALEQAQIRADATAHQVEQNQKIGERVSVAVLSALKLRVSEKQQQVASGKVRLEALQNNLKALEEERAAGKEAHQQEVARVEAKMQAQIQQLKQSERTQAKAKEKLDSATGDKADTEQQKEELEAQIRQSEEELESAKKDLQVHEQALSSLRVQVAREEAKLTELEQQEKGADLSLAQAQKVAGKVADSDTKVREQLAANSERQEQANEAAAQARAAVLTATAVASNATKAAQEAAARYDSVLAQHADSVAELHEASSTSDEQGKAELSGQVKLAEREGAATKASADVKLADGAIEAAERRLEEAQGQQAQVKKEEASAVKTLEQTEKEHTTVEDQDNAQLNEAEDKLEGLQTEAFQAYEESKQLKSELDETSKQIEARRQKLSEAHRAVELAETEVLNAKTLVRLSKQAAHEIAEKALSSSQAHKLAQTRVQQAGAALSGLEAERNTQSQMQKGARDELAQRTAELTRLQSELQQAQTEHQEAIQEHEQLLEQFKSIQASKADADRKQTQANEALVSARSSEEHATKEVKQLKKDEKDAFDQVEALEKKLKVAKAEVELALRKKSDTGSDWNSTRADYVKDVQRAHEDQEQLSHTQDKLARVQRDLEKAAAQKTGLESALAIATDRANQVTKVLTKAKEGVEAIESRLHGDEESNVALIDKLKAANAEATAAKTELTKALNAKKVAQDAVTMNSHEAAAAQQLYEETKTRLETTQQKHLIQKEKVNQRINETKGELTQYTADLAAADETITAASQTVAGKETNVSHAKEAVKAGRIHLDQKRAAVQHLIENSQGADSTYLRAHLLQQTQKRAFKASLRAWTGAEDRQMAAEENSKANGEKFKKAQYELVQAKAALRAAQESMIGCAKHYTDTLKKATASKATLATAIANEKGAHLKSMEKKGAMEELKATVEGSAADKANVMVDGDAEWQALMKGVQQTQKTEDEQDKEMEGMLGKAYMDNVTSIIDQQKAVFDSSSGRIRIFQGQKQEREAQARRAQRLAEMTRLIADQTKMRAYAARMEAAHAAGRECQQGTDCKDTVEMSDRDKGLFENDAAYRKALYAAIQAERTASEAALKSKHAQQSVTAAIAKAKQEADAAGANPMLQLDPTSQASRLKHTAKERVELQEAVDAKVEAAETQTETDRAQAHEATKAAATANAESAHQNSAIETQTKITAEKMQKLASLRAVQAKEATQFAIKLAQKTQKAADEAQQAEGQVDADLAKQLSERLTANSSQSQTIFGHDKIITPEASDKWAKDNLAFKEQNLEKTTEDASQVKTMLDAKGDEALDAKKHEVEEYKLQRKAARAEKINTEALIKAESEYATCLQVVKDKKYAFQAASAAAKPLADQAIVYASELKEAQELYATADRNYKTQLARRKQLEKDTESKKAAMGVIPAEVQQAVDKESASESSLAQAIDTYHESWDELSAARKAEAVAIKQKQDLQTAAHARSAAIEHDRFVLRTIEVPVNILEKDLRLTQEARKQKEEQMAAAQQKMQEAEAELKQVQQTEAQAENRDKAATKAEEEGSVAKAAAVQQLRDAKRIEFVAQKKSDLDNKSKSTAELELERKASQLTDLQDEAANREHAVQAAAEELKNTEDDIADLKKKEAEVQAKLEQARKRANRDLTDEAAASRALTRAQSKLQRPEVELAAAKARAAKLNEELGNAESANVNTEDVQRAATTKYRELKGDVQRSADDVAKRLTDSNQANMQRKSAAQAKADAETAKAKADAGVADVEAQVKLAEGRDKERQQESEEEEATSKSSYASSETAKSSLAKAKSALERAQEQLKAAEQAAKPVKGSLKASKAKRADRQAKLALASAKAKARKDAVSVGHYVKAQMEAKIAKDKEQVSSDKQTVANSKLEAKQNEQHTSEQVQQAEDAKRAAEEAKNKAEAQMVRLSQTAKTEAAEQKRSQDSAAAADKALKSATLEESNGSATIAKLHEEKQRLETESSEATESQQVAQAKARIAEEAAAKAAEAVEASQRLLEDQDKQEEHQQEEGADVQASVAEVQAAIGQVVQDLQASKTQLNATAHKATAGQQAVQTGELHGESENQSLEDLNAKYQKNTVMVEKAHEELNVAQTIVATEEQKEKAELPTYVDATEERTMQGLADVKTAELQLAKTKQDTAKAERKAAQLKSKHDQWALDADRVRQQAKEANTQMEQANGANSETKAAKLIAESRQSSAKEAVAQAKRQLALAKAKVEGLAAILDKTREEKKHEAMLASLASASAGDQEKAASDAASAAAAAQQQNVLDAQKVHMDEQAQDARQSAANEEAQVAKAVEQLLTGMAGPQVDEEEVRELKDKEEVAQKELDHKIASEREATVAMQHASQVFHKAKLEIQAESEKVQQASAALQAAEEALASQPAGSPATEQRRDMLDAQHSLRKVKTKFHTAQEKQTESQAEVTQAISAEHIAKQAVERAEVLYEHASDLGVQARAMYTAQKEGSLEVADALYLVTSGHGGPELSPSDVVAAKDEARSKYTALEDKIHQDSETTAKLKVVQEAFAVAQQKTQAAITTVGHATAELQSAEKLLASQPIDVSDAQKQPLQLDVDRARRILDQDKAAMSMAQEAEAKAKDAVDSAQAEEVNAKLVLKSAQLAYNKASKAAVHSAALREAQQKVSNSSGIVNITVDRRHQWAPIQDNAKGHMNRASSSLCLHSTGAREIGAPVGLFHCLYSSKSQQWDYNSETKQLKLKDGLCAQAHGAIRVVMAACNPNAPTQQFEFQHGSLRQKGTNLCIEGDSKGEGQGSWSRLSECKSQMSQQWLYNRFGLDEHWLPGTQLVMSLSISGVDEAGFSINVRNGLMTALQQVDQNLTLSDVSLTSATANDQKRVLALVRLVASSDADADTFKSAFQQQMDSEDSRNRFDSMVAAAIVPDPDEKPLALRVLLHGDIDVIPMPGPGSADCGLSQWGTFAPCSKECGGGSKVRVRTVIRHPVLGGKVCGALKETQQCNAAPCVQQACVVSQWSIFDACSKSCGTGVKKRLRRVMVQPKYGGSSCPQLEDSRQCNTFPCTADALQSSMTRQNVAEVVVLGADDK